MYLQTVLHNLALLNGDIVEPEDEEDHDDTPEPHNSEARAGENVRDILCLLQTFMCLFSISTTTCKTFKQS